MTWLRVQAHAHCPYKARAGHCYVGNQRLVSESENSVKKSDAVKFGIGR